MAEENVPPPTRTNAQLNCNFFRAFTVSAEVPAIYIQQFWYILTRDSTTRAFRFQLDEQWFDLNADLLHDALDITPKDPVNPFVSPRAGDPLLDFVNNLGYSEPLDDDHSLNNLKFVNKGESDPVFGMPILDGLITDVIQKFSYYNEYLTKSSARVARQPSTTKGQGVIKKKAPTAKQPQ
ncbi:hypothetical protein Tco_0560586 [Tanacetum coccineum]